MRTVDNFHAAESFLNGKDTRKIGNNTWIVRRADDMIAVRLHATDVVTFHRSGDIELRTGGWSTVTTRRRINDFTPGGMSVFQKNFATYVRAYGETIPMSGATTITRDGAILNGWLSAKGDLIAA